jgi:8-oxo-dGTP pyrophosphatase MutT (NUDIX family)
VFESDPIPTRSLPDGFAEAIEQPRGSPVSARPAATVVILREGLEGPEVLLLKRSSLVGFVPGAFVFPGGRVDPADAGEGLLGRAEGLETEGASDRLGLSEADDHAEERAVFPDGRPVPAAAYYAAAVREAFEETGILLGQGPAGTSPPGAESPAVRAARAAMESGSIDFAHVVEELQCTLDLRRMEYVAHWVTPLVEPRRYDTRFFAAVVPPASRVVVDDGEIVRALWTRPGDALRAHRKGDLPMIFPTVRTVEALEAFESAEAVLEHYAGLPIPRWMPRLERRGEGIVSVVDD